MNNIAIIDQPELKSKLRLMTEFGITGLIWALWIYLLLPLANAFLWIFGISTFKFEFFEKGGVIVFIELVQQMGWLILTVFLVMRVWGLYNYYHFGRRNRRNHEMPDSIEKLCRFYHLHPNELQLLSRRKQLLWPFSNTGEDIGEWLQKKRQQFSLQHQKGRRKRRATTPKHNQLEISNIHALGFSVASIFGIALLFLYIAGGLGLSEATAQEQPAMPSGPETTVSEATEALPDKQERHITRLQEPPVVSTPLRHEPDGMPADRTAPEAGTPAANELALQPAAADEEAEKQPL